jgi:hypothetical protein
MSLVQDDHVVQAFAADTPDQPFDVGVLPRRPWRCDDFLDSHTPHPLATQGAVDAASIAQQIPRGLVPWEGVADLLCGPLSGGMFPHIEVDDATSMVGQDDKDKEHFACHRWHDQEIQATKSWTWLLRKVFHVGEGGLHSRTRYFSTVDWATSMPSLRSSPTIRGEPQVGFACHIAWMSSRTSWATAGRPGFAC